MDKAYLSRSNGAFRVIYQGLPISVDKPTASEAIAVAVIYKLPLSPDTWNGDTGQWEKRE